MTVKRSRTFAYLLKHHRDAAGLTQEELTMRAGLGARTISNLERGINRAPYRDTVGRLAGALGLSGEDLAQLAASARRPLHHSSADMGEAAGAEKVVDLAQTRARLMHNRVDGLEASRVRAKVLALQGRREEATATLNEALSLACSMPYPYAEAKLSREYGMLHVCE